MCRRLVLAVAAGLGLVAALPNWGDEATAPFGTTRFDLRPLDAEGLSALWVSADGSRLIAVSDRSFALSATILRDAQGLITGLADLVKTPLLGPKSAPIDSEGMAVGPSGEVYISTEGPARIFVFGTLAAVPRPIKTSREFARLAHNGALEALALSPAGTLITLPEAGSGGAEGFALYALTDGQWRVLARLPMTDDFLPVGADFGPDGRLYILFRKFSALNGFSSRLQRHDFSEDGLGSAEVLLESPFGLLGNLEGVAVWRRADGPLVATMVTDDNGIFLQDSALIELPLPD